MTTPTDPEILRAEIEQTRAELGQTVEALAERTDVRTRARRAAAGLTRPLRVAAFAVGAACSAIVVFLFKRRRSG